MKCVILLSEKSSGSSPFQNLLSQTPAVKRIAKTSHYENETLYWTKAASILQMPQLEAIDSEVPIERFDAKIQLIRLLKENLDNYHPPVDERELIFDGWQKLCEKFQPVFLEKSPHHLYQWSAIELILECMDRLKGVQFLVVGLIRNPMDTIYSQFRRWRTRPESLQNQWIIAYQNLRRLKKMLKEKLVIVQYEDVAQSVNVLRPVFDFCNIKETTQNFFHKKSIGRWKNDRLFGFSLSSDAIALAEYYGYQRKDLVNTNGTAIWPTYRELVRIGYKTKNFSRKSVKAVASIASSRLSRH